MIPRVALVMMVKNEHQRILVSLESVKDIVQKFIIFDTGSNDNTIEIIKNFCKKHSIQLHLKIGTFVNFEVSRNECLDFADTVDDIDFLLLLDCNDELKNGKSLIKFLKKELYSNDTTSYLIAQEWWSGVSNKYFNMRLIKHRQGWRFKGVVHEYLCNKDPLKDGIEKAKYTPSDVVLFQDRTKDDDKSSKRFSRDKQLLFEEYTKNPVEPRTLFYLAQTCECLQHLDEAVKYYKERLLVQGFYEEKFHAAFRIGKINNSRQTPPENIIYWWLHAFEILPRAEPLLELAKFYTNNKQFSLAYIFIKQACELPYPKDILFVDNNVYDYERWHYLGIIAYYVDKKEDGLVGCLKAIAAKNLDVDHSNAKFYSN